MPRQDESHQLQNFGLAWVVLPLQSKTGE